MTYQALYRRWRPKVFEDIVGQGHIVTTLKNQIKKGNISHAYLFSGTRGTGKTSTAKIFARAVNCLEPEDFNPCNKCEVCEGILADNIMDVIEIDAASNNGVDHIREIRESVKYPPSKGKYKVYIIDEVHMLSTGAFNALLKTLEEPPKHIIFILATTEPQKLPATILSRCQRFDFRPVRQMDIMDHLKHILTAIGIEYEEKALSVIASNGRGSVRDSLSILEQCISFCRDQLSYELVVETLGITDEELLWSLSQAILKRDTSEALMLVQQVVKEGKDVQQLIKDLIGYFHNLMLIRLKSTYSHQALSEALLTKLEQQAIDIDVNKIVQLIYALSEAESKIRYASQPQIILEVTIVSLCSITDNQDELLERIRKLEAMVSNGSISIGNSGSVKKVAIKELSQEERQPVKGSRAVKEMAPVTPNDIEVTSDELQEDSAPLDFNIIKDKWEEILEVMRQDKKAQIKAFLKEGELINIKGRNLVIAFKEGFGFHREALDKEKTKAYISSIIQQVTAQTIGLYLVMESELNLGGGSPKEEEALARLKEVVPEGILEIIGD